jgi:methylated-DNA-[protein]-cysteine S-methyltransferase
LVVNSVAVRRVSSPVGDIVVTANDEGVTSLEFDEDAHAELRSGSTQAATIVERAVEQLQQYFAGERRDFDLPLAPEGTDFQRAVWAALSRIPYGTTISYKEQATWVGNPKATRAVGSANGRNPIAIVVPCHRVIGSDGRPTGYASGIDRKLWLLEHERAVLGH